MFAPLSCQRRPALPCGLVITDPNLHDISSYTEFGLIKGELLAHRCSPAWARPQCDSPAAANESTGNCPCHQEGTFV